MAQPNPRDIVFSTLSRWADPSDPPFLPERSDPQWAQLSPRDRPFAYDLLTGILRMRGALDAVIVTCLKQPIDTLDHSVRVILWLGAYQILFQGTADYAAVDTAVDLARRINPRVSGLINAILRNITRLEPRRVAVTPAPGASPQAGTSDARLSRHLLALDFDTDLRFNRGVFFDPVRAKVAHLAAVRSYPMPLVAHMLAIYPEQAADILLAGNQRPVVTLRVDADAHEIPASAGVAAHATEPRFLVALDGWNDYIEQRVEAGTLSPQDVTSAKPVRQLAAQVAAGKLPAPRRILDLCAGLGTKTVQLARTFPQAQVAATDIDALKLTRLEARIKRLKLTNVTIESLPEIPTPTPGTPNPTPVIENQKSKIKNDIILLDVPCSNTGVFAKRVQSRWRWPRLDQAQLAALQLKLLRQAAGMLAPAGAILYATCSIDPAENTARVQSFLTENPAFQLLAEQLTLPSGAGLPAARCDGGYYALLQRKA